MVDELTKRDNGNVAVRGDVQTPNAPSTARARGPLSDWFGIDPFDVFRDFYANAAGSGGSGLNITRTQGGYTAEIAVPGYAPDQIEVTYQDGGVMVTGKNERRSFSRSLSLSDDIDPDNISARVEHGLLTLTLNRHPRSQPKKISIQH